MEESADNNTTKNDDDVSVKRPKRSRSIRKVCLFGTSGNPPTGDSGHVGIVKILISIKQFDEIRILPVYSHSFSSKHKDMASYDDRIKMCQLAFEELSTPTTRVVVSKDEEKCYYRILEKMKEEQEQEQNGDTNDSTNATSKPGNVRVGTASLLDMLLEEDDEQDSEEDTGTSTRIEYTFCLGADTFLDLIEWKWIRSQDVVQLLKGRLLVLFRHGVTRKIRRRQVQVVVNTTACCNTDDSTDTNDDCAETIIEKRITQEDLQQRIDEVNQMDIACNNVRLLNITNADKDTVTLEDVSSTMIRKLCCCSDSSNNGDIDKVLAQLQDQPNTIHPNVLKYIIDHKLYGLSTHPNSTTSTSTSSSSSATSSSKS